MIQHRFTAQAKCGLCGRYRDVDLRALLDKVGRDFSFWNRRCPCNLTLGCPGWIHFYIGPGWSHLAADEATEYRWMALEGEEQRAWRDAMDAAEKNGGWLPVQRGDRDAAGLYVKNEGRAMEAKAILAGKSDRHLLVQAFAWHAVRARIKRSRDSG